MFMVFLMFVGFLRESEAVSLLAEEVWVEDEMPDGSNVAEDVCVEVQPQRHQRLM